MAESFTQINTESMAETVPKKEVTLQSRTKKPPWWNEGVSKTKRELNIAKKSVRRRRTPHNFNELKMKESKFEEVSMKEDWVDQICTKISYANSAKEMWESFKDLTSYQDKKGVGVLPFLDENKHPTFDREEKYIILQDVFFGGPFTRLSV